MKMSVDELLGSEPVTLVDAKLHLRTVTGDTSEDAGIILPIIAAAREYCENITGTAIRKQRIKAYPNGMPKQVRLRKQPLISVETIKMYWADGTSTTLAEDDYTVDAVGGEIYITTDIPRGEPRIVNPMEITYIAGYEDPPKAMRQAMLLLIAHWYENREAVVVGSTASVDVSTTVTALLRQYRAWWF